MTVPQGRLRRLGSYERRGRNEEGWREAPQSMSGKASLIYEHKMSPELNMTKLKFFFCCATIMEDLSASLKDKLAHSSFRLKTAERERHVVNNLLVATPCEAVQYCPRLGRITICHSINRFDSAFGFNPSRLLSCGAAFSEVTALIMIV